MLGFRNIQEKLENIIIQKYLFIPSQKTIGRKPGLSLRPESSENIPILFQGADLYFSNQNYLRNPKMGSKQSVVVPPRTDFVKKLFLAKKIVEKTGRVVDF